MTNKPMLSVEREFKREDRYVVVKRSDLDRIPNRKVVHAFLAALAEVSAHSVRIPQRDFLVIESDWPEFDIAYQMIEARMTGQPAAQHQGEPTPITDDMDRLMEAYRLGEFSDEGGSATVEALSVAAFDSVESQGHDADSYMAGYCAALYEQAKPLIWLAFKPKQQGEPVYMVRSHGSDCWEEMSGESLEMCHAQPVEYEVRKLYAEQPAPVAVVMPERKTKADYSGYIEQFQSEAAGLYNSALDDVARLNGVNPVAADAPSRDELIKMLRHFASCANVVQVGTAAMDFVARLNGVKPLSAAAPKIEFVACTAYNMGGDGYAEQTQTCCGSCPGGCVANLNGVKP